MKHTLKSLNYSLTGLLHALTSERNLMKFLPIFGLVLILAAILKITALEWCVLILAGGLFMATELLNTALERLVDTVHDLEQMRIGGTYHLGLKLTKDVAAGAALISFVTVIAVILIVLIPYLIPLLIR